MRRITRGGGAYFIIALFSVPLAVVGYEWLGSEEDDSGKFPVVIVDNGEEITVNDVRRRSRLLLLGMEDISSLSASEHNEIVIQLASRMTEEIVLNDEAKQRNMRVPTDLINVAIADDPLFKPDGRFSVDAYRSILTRSGYTLIEYRDVVAKQEMMSQLLSGYHFGATYSAGEVKQLADWYERERDAHYFIVRATDFLSEIELQESSLLKEYEKNGENYVTEAMVRVKYFVVAIEDYYNPVLEEAVERFFQRELALLQSSEDVRHILLRVSEERDDTMTQAALRQLRQQYEEGADFLELAKEHSEDYASRDSGGYLGTLSRDSFPDSFISAVDELQAGEVSLPVRTELGWHLIYYPGGDDIDLDELRENVRIRTQTLRDRKVYERGVERTKDLALGSVSLERVVSSFPGKTVDYSPTFSSEGTEEGIFSDPDVVALMFGEGMLNHDILDVRLDEGRTLIAQLDEYIPATQLTLDEARPELEEILKLRQARKSLDERTQTLLGTVRENITDGRDSAPAGYTWTDVVGLKRYDQEHHEGVVANAVFSLPLPEDKTPVANSGKVSEHVRIVVVSTEERVVEIDKERLDYLSQQFVVTTGIAYAELYAQNLLLQHRLQYPRFNAP